MNSKKKHNIFSKVLKGWGDLFLVYITNTHFIVNVIIVMFSYKLLGHETPLPPARNVANSA